MPPVAELVARARAAGVTFSRADDGTLRMRGPRRLADLARALREHEAEVLALLGPDRRCYCGAAVGVRMYVSGWRCPQHTPAALAGRPEPDRRAPVHCLPRSARPLDADTYPWPADETGRCATCRRPCHRYGAGGGPLCTDCRHRTGATT